MAIWILKRAAESPRRIVSESTTPGLCAAPKNASPLRSNVLQKTPLQAGEAGCPIRNPRRQVYLPCRARWQSLPTENNHETNPFTLCALSVLAASYPGSTPQGFLAAKIADKRE